MIKKNQKLFIIFTIVFLYLYLNSQKDTKINFIQNNKVTQKSVLKNTTKKHVVYKNDTYSKKLNSKLESTEFKKLDENECWETEFDLFEEDLEFINKNKNIFNRFVGPWFYDSKINLDPDQETSIGGLFLLAIAKSEMIEPQRKNTNFEEALEILNLVNKEDPTNSAPLIFAAEIHRRNGNFDQMDLLLNKALQTQRFDTYQSHFSQMIFDQVESPNQLVAAINLNSKLPIVRTSALKNTIINPIYAPLAFQMIEGALDPVHDIDPSHFGESLQYAVGDIILKKMGDTSKRKPAGEISGERLNLNKCKPGIFLEYLEELKKKRNK